MESKLLFLMQVRITACVELAELSRKREIIVFVSLILHSSNLLLVTNSMEVKHFTITPLSVVAQGLTASREEAVSIIFKYPQLLNLSIDKNLKLKLDFFKGELGGSDKEVRDAIIGSPTLLGYSLKARLRRRVEVLRLLGVAPSFEEHVWLISSSTGLRFNRTVEKMVMRERGVVIKGDKEVERVMKRFRAVLRGEG